MVEEVLVIGASGLVGSRFVELHADKNELLTPSHAELDITKRQSVTDYFSRHQPEVVINFAAYTNVGEAEKQRGDENGDCWGVNVDGVKNLIETTGDRLIQISTDMVFPGNASDPGPYEESHHLVTDESLVTWYGWTKAEAERLGPKTILRLIYPIRAKFAKKLDYLRKPLQAFDQGKLWPLFTDQQVSFCFIDEACLALSKIIEIKATGIFHTSSKDTATPFELVSYLLAKSRGYTGELTSGLLDEFLKNPANSPVRYPKFGGLKVEGTEKRLGIKFSTWREIIDRLVDQGISVSS